MPKIFLISSTIGSKISISKLVFTPCIQEAILSKPIPVSIFFLGNGSNLPPSLRLNCVNTKFQISTNLPQSQLGEQFSFPQPVSSPQSKNISEHGPHNPFGPSLIAFAGQKFSFWPNL